MSARYWLYDWLDEKRVSSLARAARLLSDSREFDSLREFAHAALTTRAEASTNSQRQVSLLAGRGVDLSGHLDCYASQCRKLQVDRLLKRVWHYFDKVVVADAIGHEVAFHTTSKPDDLRKWILSHIEVLLYLREVGADSLVEFSLKPIPCELHWRKHAVGAGLQSLLNAADDQIEVLARDARIERGTSENEYVFVHPHFEHTQWVELRRSEVKGKSRLNARKLVATAVVRRFVAHLTSDIMAARKIEMPLGSTIRLYRQLMTYPEVRSDPKISGRVEESTIFELDLPFLEGIPIRTLIRVREDERECFERFRNRLRFAVSELAGQSFDSGPSGRARRIQNDLIEPELRTIRDKLKAAERVLVKKTAVGISMGTLATTCGLLAGAAPALAVGAGVAILAGSAVNSASQNIEDRKQAELSDMYFLWKAARHKHGKI